jgi:predicted carbohydrate-binding protein with CBM5 and CBM33 domain
VKQSSTEIQEQELKQQQELFELLAQQIQDLEQREAELAQKFEQDDSEQMLLNK